MRRRSHLRRWRNVIRIVEAAPGRGGGPELALLHRREKAFDAAAALVVNLHADGVVGIIATHVFFGLSWELRFRLRRGRLRRPGHVTGVIKAGPGRTPDGPLPALLH